MLTGNELRAWRLVLRQDSCSYCGAPAKAWDPRDRSASTVVDHIEPIGLLNQESFEVYRRSGEHMADYGVRREQLDQWENLTAACYRCNRHKSDRTLLSYLLWRLDRMPGGVHGAYRAAA